nr:MAG TPA: hypothetical protein [Caudoviricetes sp.]
MRIKVICGCNSRNSLYRKALHMEITEYMLKLFIGMHSYSELGDLRRKIFNYQGVY